MSGRCVFIGEEVSAAGFRLAGVEVHVPAATEVTELFRRLLGEAALILIDAGTSARLPPPLLARAVREQRPRVLVIADIRGLLEPVDMIGPLKRQLGLAE